MRKVLLVSLVLIVNCSAPTEKKSSEAAVQLQLFLEGFSNSHPRGRSQADDELSRASFDKSLEKTKAQLVALRSIDPGQLKGHDLIDWKFAQSILVGCELELEKIQA